MNKPINNMLISIAKDLNDNILTQHEIISKYNTTYYVIRQLIYSSEYSHITEKYNLKRFIGLKRSLIKYDHDGELFKRLYKYYAIDTDFQLMKQSNLSCYFIKIYKPINWISDHFLKKIVKTTNIKEEYWLTGKMELIKEKVDNNNNPTIILNEKGIMLLLKLLASDKLEKVTLYYK